MASTSSGTEGRAGSVEHNLPAPLTSLVGRARELERITESLRATRLVTLTGPGGVGKTRLALTLARRQLSRRPDGVWIVDLASGPEPPDVEAEAARVLDVRGPRGTPATDALRRYLTDRDVLLVLDNCEHVVDACAELAAALLSTCASVRIMATSRESLGVDGETVWRLKPLGPEDAYRLFVERARQRQPDFMPGEETDATIAELCARLDRLPLAIELAAARVSVMSPDEVLAGLKTRLGMLGGGGRLTPVHHRTVRAAVEWSHQLLDPVEQEAFRSLAVFVGGFDASAARAVAPGLSLDVLARLVDKSLVAVIQTARGRTRYRLLETVREYACELLLEADEWDAARERHLRHVSALADVAREEWLSTGAQRFVNQLDDDYENVRAVVEWAAGSDPCAAMRVLGGTRDLFFRFGQADGLRLAEVLLERCPARDRHRVEAQISAGQLAISSGDPERARSLLAQARELSAELGEPVLEAWVRFFQGLGDTLAGSLETGREHLQASRALHGELGIRIGEARSIAVLGMTFLLANEAGRAKELLEAALAIYEAEQDRWGQGQCHTFLGVIAESSASDTSRATAHYRKAVDLLRPSRDATLLPVALICQAGVLGRRDPAGALKVVAAACAIRARVGGEFAPFYRVRLERIRAAGEQAVGDDAGLLSAQGARLGIDDAVALAFGDQAPRPALPAGVSARELEVAGLVAEGLTNKAIASRLHLSVRTVESHVRHLLAKVALENRTQLASWVRERTQ
ncbi:MAG: Transcriptional regulator, AfsR family [uncultured Solirubrobacteraceae bacterium]|uniref:Transcriptional regulator, AfsR family n=1 Tax=uncultured Solirubrobacteraceae bacterium TaxID=1162706 RepID=A0A6J4S8L9_9ACTN|nr:MAG: Transcriptional regulator, AfsR family [uncultured Solirubrobacteraceae bacterium]